MKNPITITITIDANGSVTMSPSTPTTKKKRKSKRRVKKTDTTYTDLWGKQWPIYESVQSGHKFILRKGKSGEYRHYIKK